MRVVLALILAQLAGAAEASDWQSVGPWGGVDLRLSVTDPNGQRVFATSELGLFRSDDRGESWISLPAPAGRRVFPAPAQLALTPADADRVLAVFDHRYAYLSDDGGQTWTLLLDAQAQGGTGREEFGAVAIHPVQASRMSVFQGVGRVHPDELSIWANLRWYRSEDSGLTFDSQPVEPMGWASTCSRVSLSATSARYVEGHDEQILISMAATCPPFLDYDLVRLDSAGQHLVSTGGVTAGYFEQLPESDVRIASDRIYWVFGGALAEIIFSNGAMRILRKGVLEAYLDTNDRLWATSSEGLIFSDDLGTTWLPDDAIGFGLGGVQAQDAISVQGFAEGRLLASNRESVFVLESGAVEWRVSAQGISGLPVVTLALANGGESIWTGLGRSVSKTQWIDMLPTARVLYRSGDGGNSWHTSNIDTYARWLNVIVVDAATDTGPGTVDLYAAGAACALTLSSSPCVTGLMSESFGLYRSRDSGANWEALGEGLDNSDFLGMRALAMNSEAGSPGARSMLAGRWARGNLNKPVYASVNSGEEWFESSDGLFDVATAPNHERPEVTMIRYSLAQPGLVFATTRTRVPSVNVQDGTIPTGVFRSVDGGVTWQHRSNGLPRYGADHAHAGVAAIALHPQLAGVAWALTEEWNPVTREYTSRVFKTEDGGLAWQSASSNLPVGWYGALLVEPQRPDYLYVGGAQGVFFSSDAGERWTKLGQRQLRMVRSLEVGADHVFAGGSQSVHRIARPHHLDPVFRSGFESGDPN